MKYALIDNATNRILREETREFDADELLNIARKFGADKDKRIVPSIELPDPSFDPDTERLAGFGDPVVETDRVTRIRLVVTISQRELEDRSIRDKAQAVYDALDNGTGTNLERLVRIEKALAHLIKINYL